MFGEPCYVRLSQAGRGCAVCEGLALHGWPGRPLQCQGRGCGGAALGGAGHEGHVGSEQAWRCSLRGRGAEWADGAPRSSGWAPAPGGGRPWRLCTMWCAWCGLSPFTGCGCREGAVGASREPAEAAQSLANVQWIYGKAEWDHPLLGVGGSLESDLEFAREKKSGIFTSVSLAQRWAPNNWF